MNTASMAMWRWLGAVAGKLSHSCDRRQRRRGGGWPPPARKRISPRAEVAYWTAVFILVVVLLAASLMALFKLYDRAGGDEMAVKIVKLGFAMWLIFALSSAGWLITMIVADHL